MKAQEQKMLQGSEREKRTPVADKDVDAEQISQQTQGQNAAEGYGPGLEYPSGGYPIAGEPPTSRSISQSAFQTVTGVAAGAPALEELADLTHRLGDAAGYAADGSDKPGEASTNADYLSGTTESDYSSQGDDSMLSDNVGGDSGGDFGGD
jgi:hypothetical protein